MLFKNPEFIKNIKLELSWTRLLIPAFVMGLVAWIGWGSGEFEEWKGTPETYEKGLSLTFWMFGFGFIYSIVWGSYLASNSLFGEMRQKTWDFVRMSSLSPHKIMFGKLWGATSGVWIITLLGTIPLILFAADYLFLTDGYQRASHLTLTSLTISIILWMIFSYTVVMLSGTYTYSRDSRHATIGAVLFVLIMGLFIGGFIADAYSDEYKIYETCQTIKDAPPVPCDKNNTFMVDGKRYMAPNFHMTNWYQFKLFPLDVITMVLGFAAFWSSVALYRTLRTSLQYQDSPYIWPIFLVTTAFFLNGFFINERNTEPYLTLMAIFTALAILPVCMKESRNTIQYRQFFENIKSGQWKHVFRLTPLWLISLLCFVFLSPAVFMYAGKFLTWIDYTHPNGSNGYVENLKINPPSVYFNFYISIILLAVRDIMAFHIIAWRPSIRIPIIGMFIYLLVMYLFLPVMSNVMFTTSSAAGEYYLMALIPYRDYSGPLKIDSLIYFGLHLSIISVFFFMFVKSLKRILK